MTPNIQSSPANPLQPFLDQFGVVILDGALATELERRGADLHDPLWSAKLLLESPDLIQQVHYDYFRAGADVATSASYQATFEGFADRGLTAVQAEDLMRLSVRLAQAARDQFWADPSHRTGRLRPLVAASIGPYGAYLHDGSEYRGDYGLSVTELMNFHRPRLAVLAESGADLLACETIPCQVEAEALLRLLAQFPQSLAWVSFSCRDGQSVWHGESLSDCIAFCNQSAQVVAVGVNCTAPRHITALLKKGAAVAQTPLLVYPNSGETWDAQRHCWISDTGTTDFRPLVQTWYNLGMRLSGGCCRTTPPTIAQISHTLRLQYD